MVSAGDWNKMMGVSGNLAETAVAKATTAGQLPYATGANALAMLSLGTAGQQLKVNSGATAPEWGSVSPPMVRARNSSAISVSSSTWTTFTMDAEDFDTDTMHSTSSNTDRITFTTAGKYLVQAHIYLNSGGNTLDVGARLALNAGATIIHNQMMRGGTNNYQFDMVCIRDFAAGDYVVTQVWHQAGSTQSLIGAASSDGASYVAAVRLG